MRKMEALGQTIPRPGRLCHLWMLMTKRTQVAPHPCHTWLKEMWGVQLVRSSLAQGLPSWLFHQSPSTAGVCKYLRGPCPAGHCGDMALSQTQSVPRSCGG